MNELTKGISIMKNRVLKAVLMLAMTAVLSFTYSGEVHATMTQDEATEWLKQWCEENGYDFDDCKTTGGLDEGFYVGNRNSQTSSASTNNVTQEASAPAPSMSISTQPTLLLTQPVQRMAL